MKRGSKIGTLVLCPDKGRLILIYVTGLKQQYNF